MIEQGDSAALMRKWVEMEAAYTPVEGFPVQMCHLPQRNYKPGIVYLDPLGAAITAYDDKDDQQTVYNRLRSVVPEDVDVKPPSTAFVWLPPPLRPRSPLIEYGYMGFNWARK